MDSIIDDRLGIGGNNPPDPIEILRGQLAETHAPLADRQAAILDMDARLPASCDDEDTAKKLADGVKVCMTFAKNSEAARVAAKEPYLAAERAVDAWFKNLASPVERLKGKIAALLTAYQRRIEAEERARREAEAARLRAEAAEADRLRREAQAAARKAEEERLAAERAAREAKDAADREVAQARAASARAEAEKLAADQAARDAKAEAAAAKEAAARAAQAAKEKPAELTRQRSDLGSVASLRRTWDFEIVDADAVPRMFMRVDDAAIRAYIKSSTDKKTGDCRAKIDGIRVFEKHDTVVR